MSVIEASKLRKFYSVFKKEPGKNIILSSHPFFGTLLLWFYSLKLSFDKNEK